MRPVHRATLRGLGAYIPKKLLTNFDLEKMVDTTDEWIRTRTGIETRYIAEKGQSASDLGVEACRQALENAKLKASEVELIIVATITPDMLFPSTACYIQNKLGAKCGAFDMAAACSGFPYALAVGQGFVESGMYQTVLVVGTEVLSSFIDWKDRSTCVLFGDGAGAAVVTRSQDDQSGILSSYLGSDGSQAGLLQIPGGGSMNPPSEETIKGGLHFLKMQGSEVFKVAVRTMDAAVREVIKQSGMGVQDIDCLIPHQANLRILQAVAHRLEIPMEKIFINVMRYGNMSSASTIVALYDAVKMGKIKKGDDVVLVAFGGGLTWAANHIRW
ncbi:MAG: ketoacyl-ACP synthase III [Candidatus Omnitrophica bacterium]|nr:ketoacyl-ACP synthase III [Candidatus Omnitrophota bacterium]